MDIKNKAQITIQTFFFLLMGICFVWILIFGYNQIINVNEQLSNQERLLIENELKEALEYCEDPLNKGSKKTLEFNSKEFNGICLIGKKNFSSDYGQLGIELNNFKSQNIKENVYLIDANINLNNQKYNITNPKIVGTFYADFGTLTNSYCDWETIIINC